MHRVVLGIANNLEEAQQALGGEGTDVVTRGRPDGRGQRQYVIIGNRPVETRGAEELIQRAITDLAGVELPVCETQCGRPRPQCPHDRFPHRA